MNNNNNMNYVCLKITLTCTIPTITRFMLGDRAERGSPENIPNSEELWIKAKVIEKYLISRLLYLFLINPLTTDQ